MKVQTFFDEEAGALDSEEEEEYDSAEDSPESLVDFIVDDNLESKSEVRSLNSLLDSVSDSDSQSVKKRKLGHNFHSSSSDEEINKRQVKRKRGCPLGSKIPKVVPKKMSYLQRERSHRNLIIQKFAQNVNKLFISFIKKSN